MKTSLLNSLPWILLIILAAYFGWRVRSNSQESSALQQKIDTLQKSEQGHKDQADKFAVIAAEHESRAFAAEQKADSTLQIAAAKDAEVKKYKALYQYALSHPVKFISDSQRDSVRSALFSK